MRNFFFNAAAVASFVSLAACSNGGAGVSSNGAQSISAANSTLAAGARPATFANTAFSKQAGSSSGISIDAGSGSAVGSWVPDTDYSGGATYTVSNSINTSSVSNPAPQSVYQTQRYGSILTYVIPNLTPNGDYTVRLHLAETFFTGSGQRVFNVTINGAQVLSNFDIFSASGGEYIAIVKQFSSSADSAGRITITFAATVNNATIAGIQITGGSSSPTPAPTATPSSGGGTAYPSAGWIPFRAGPMVSSVSSIYGSSPAMVSNSANIINNLWGPNTGDMGLLQMVLGGPAYWSSVFGTGNGQRVSESFFVSSASDPAYTVSCNLYSTACNTGVVHIPANAFPSTDSDHHMGIRDLATGLDWQFWEGTIPSGYGGTFVAGTANSQPTATSEGIGIGGTASNINTAVWAVRPEDVLAGRIPHALAIETTCDVSTNGDASGAYVYPVVPNPVDGAATDNRSYCGSGYGGQYPNNSGSNVNLEYGAHLWLDVPNASIPPVSGSCDLISRAYLRALNEFGAYVTDVGALGAPIMILAASDINDTYNGGASKWQQVFAQISGYGYGSGSSFQFNPTSCGIDLQAHLHVLTPPAAN